MHECHAATLQILLVSMHSRANFSEPWAQHKPVPQRTQGAAVATLLLSVPEACMNCEVAQRVSSANAAGRGSPAQRCLAPGKHAWFLGLARRVGVTQT